MSLADVARVPISTKPLIDSLVAERGSVYGPPARNHGRTALLWTAYLQAAGLLPEGVSLNAYNVTALNRLQKEARLLETPAHPDSLADIAGYAENDRLIAEALSR